MKKPIGCIIWTNGNGSYWDNGCEYLIYNNPVHVDKVRIASKRGMQGSWLLSDVRRWGKVTLFKDMTLPMVYWMMD